MVRPPLERAPTCWCFHDSFVQATQIDLCVTGNTCDGKYKYYTILFRKLIYTY